jgi:transcriptional regulator with XRE-family HTH domain
MRLDSDKLKELRENRGWTQDILSRKRNADVSVRTIQRAECGCSIRRENAEFIAAALEVPLSELRAKATEPDRSARDNNITLRRIGSGKVLIETLHRSDMCRLDCDVDPDGSNVETLKSLASLIEARIPDPLSWTEEHVFNSLADRLEVTALLNDYLRALEALGIGVFVGSYSEQVRMPTISPYEEPSVKPGTRPMPAVLTRIVIAAIDGERLVVEKDYRWPVAIWTDEPSAFDLDLNADVPF